MATIKRLTGRTGTPLLLHEGGALDGSARIIEWLDAHAGAPALVPTDPAEREEALRIQRWFDEDLTPRIRRPVLDFVATRSAVTGYLCGDAFSVADLTAASTLAVLIRPVGTPMSCPLPVARSFRALMERHAHHPGAVWVRRIYAQHRGARCDFEGPSASAA